MFLWVLFKVVLHVWFLFHQQAKKRRIVASNEVLDKSRGAACYGNSSLIELLASYATVNAHNEAPLKVGVVGKCVCVYFFSRSHDPLILF